MKTDTFIIKIILLTCLIFPGAVLYANGKIRITSSPSNAEIFIDGRSTKQFTPSIIKFNDTLTHELELQLPHHVFSKREIKAVRDSTIDLSLNLMALSDTAMIIGDLELGILSLTAPPLKIPYSVDGKSVYTKDVILNAGLHQIEWNGGEIYSSLDTILTISSGKMTVLHFYPDRLSGTINVNVIPEDATVFLNEIQYGTGNVSSNVNTGSYNLSIKRKGFTPFDTLINIKPDKLIHFDITMKRIPDEDEDGFLDSIDLCPKTYGLYDGCPKQKKSSALKKYTSMLGENLKSQKFNFSLGLLSWQSRKALNKKEATFFSYFNDGISFFNNYHGVSILNSLKLSARGFYLDLEYNQYSQGIKYEKERKTGNGPVLFYKDEKDSNTYCLYYDTLAGLSPSVFFPSVSISAGINFKMQRFDLSLFLGYQWEHIIYTDILLYSDYLNYQNNDSNYLNPYQEYGGPKHSWKKESDWVFSGLNLSYNLIKNERNSLLIYGKFRISVYDHNDIQWSAFHAGLTYRFTPSIREKIGISTEDD